MIAAIAGGYLGMIQMKPGQCGAPGENSKPICRTAGELQNVQQYPFTGPLKKNLGSPLCALESAIGKSDSRVYSYVLQTVEMDEETTSFQQAGSGPNFQGGVLTLCTCKHQMRATQSSDEWKGVWVAGFTSRTIYDGRHWLFYLARIKSTYESHADLWQAMPARIRNAKAADRHFLGDMFRPKSPKTAENARFSPSQYVVPVTHVHRQHPGAKGWRNDINYRHADKYGHPALLVADPRRTFLWNEPAIYFDGEHCRNFYKWSTLREFVSRLRQRKWRS
jgi:hypothetical protein